MDVCLRVLKKNNKSRFDSYSVREQCIDHIPYYLSGLSRPHFVRTTFLKIAVYYLRPDLEPTLLGHYSGALAREAREAEHQG